MMQPMADAAGRVGPLPAGATSPARIEHRVASLEWARIGADLDMQGCASRGPLLTQGECDALAGDDEADGLFRSRVVMARHGFGRGEFRYYAYPFPKGSPPRGRRFTHPWPGSRINEDGSCVGLVHDIRHRSCWTEGDYCYLQDLYVTAEARGRGTGRALIEHVYASATTMGCSRVYWLTHESNAEAVQLYDRMAERSGFVQYRKVLTTLPNTFDEFDPTI